MLSTCCNASPKASKSWVVSLDASREIAGCQSLGAQTLCVSGEDRGRNKLDSEIPAAQEVSRNRTSMHASQGQEEAAKRGKRKCREKRLSNREESSPYSQNCDTKYPLHSLESANPFSTDVYRYLLLQAQEKKLSH